MRKPSLTPVLAPVLALVIALVAALAAVGSAGVVAASAQSGPPRPKAELTTAKVRASLGSGTVAVRATIRNKGTKKARASFAVFYLSADATRDASDTMLGTKRVPTIRSKRVRRVTATLALPASVPAGSYHVVVCADHTGIVRERRETNNCRGSARTVTVPAGCRTSCVIPPATARTVSATASPGGTVAASGVTGGTCVQTTCTFPTSGTGTVTFTPTADAGYRFKAWTGATCTGYTSGQRGAITFDKPTSDRACTASFVRQVRISWTVAPLQLFLVGTVSGQASDGTCTPADPLTGAGSCLVDAGVGTVQLTAQTLVLPFKSWSGATCDGAATGPVMLITSPAAAKTCTATFGP